MKSPTFRFVLTTLLTTSILLTGFYFFILKPKLELPSSLLYAEEVISSNEINLLRNRLSLLGLVNLKITNNPTVGDEKEFLISRLVETSKKMPKDIKNVDGFKPLSDAYPALLAENIDILQRQTALIEKLSAISESNKNIFKYRPRSDLGLLNPIDDKDAIIERANAAVEGLENVKKKFENVEELSSKITQTQVLLRDMADQLNAGNALEAGRLYDELFQAFRELREISLKMETDLIKSPEIVQLITDQTNLMLKYNFWLEKIDEEQAKLLDRNLYGF